MATDKIVHLITVSSDGTAYMCSWPVPDSFYHELFDKMRDGFGEPVQTIASPEHITALDATHENFPGAVLQFPGD